MRHRWPLGGVIFILFPSGLGVYIPMSQRRFVGQRLEHIVTCLLEEHVYDMVIDTRG